MEIIHKTKNYDLFKSIMSNREVDKVHVKRLAKSIKKKNLLYIRPLIVNDHMELIDGQHRLAAAASIDADVYYLKSHGLSKDDIAILNTAQKNWTRMDFINFFAIEGRKEYVELSKFMNKYAEMKASTLISLACAGIAKVREGIIDISNIKVAVTICEQIRELRTILKEKRKEHNHLLARDFGVAYNDCVGGDENKFRVIKKTFPICTSAHHEQSTTNC